MDAKALIVLVAQGSLILLVTSVGLRARWQDVRSAALRSGLLGRSVVAVNLVVPAVAVLVCLALPIDIATRRGIIIMAVSPLAPLVPLKMLRAGMHASTAIGLYLALLLLSVAIVPITVALLGALSAAGASTPFPAVASLLLTSVLAPVAVGMAVGALAPGLAERIAPIFEIAGNVALLLFLVVVLAATRQELLPLARNGAIFAIVVTVAAGLAAGHLLRGPAPASRIGLAFAAATRHPGIAALIAAHNYGDRQVMLAILLFLMISVVVSALYYRWARRRLTVGAGRPAAS